MICIQIIEIRITIIVFNTLPVLSPIRNIMYKGKSKAQYIGLVVDIDFCEGNAEILLIKFN